ncbi:MAG: FtsX-like permease family protein [Oscillospiraceae bacterium]|nr:FtsX-like permease family protein [Oscillospiraceae bacterium]
MKRLSINHISAASIRANRKTYLSLAAGIVLAVLLATVMTLCAFGIIEAREQQIVQTVGYTDCILLDEPDITDESLRQSGLFDRIGHQFVAASVTDSTVYLGWLDEAGQDIVCRALAEGRMPEHSGEIAIERSALEKLRLEAEVGDTVTWTLLPIDGVPEEHCFTIVGILKEQSGALDVSGFAWSASGVLNWPSALISSEESFATGRVAAHRVMTYAPFTSLSQVEKRYSYGLFFGVSRTQGAAQPTDPAEMDAAGYADMIAMLLILGLALLLAVCIGISSAMEGVLASKTEEIGMLRAVGATKRQIRRIFGRDAWLLSLIALPIGLLFGLVLTWLLCRMAPGEMIFAPYLWLLFPILLISALCIVIASGLPLRRASKQMPMGVLRDTALLRKAGSFKSKRSFHATELIAARQLRIHPWRQIGAALLVAATLLCAAIIGEQSYDAVSEFARSKPVAFSLTNQKATFSNTPFSVVRPENQLSEQDVAQIRGLPLVDYASLEAQTKVNLILYDEVPDYFLPFTGGTLGQGTDGENTWVYNIFGGGSGLNYLSISPDDPEPPTLGEDASTTERQQSRAWEQYRQMRALMEAQGLAGKPVHFTFYVTDLSRVDFTDRIAEGKVDLAAIDAGQQVLVYAPTYHIFRLEDGMRIAAALDAWGRAASEAEFENDFFHAGQTLELVQFVQEHLFDDVSDEALRAQFAQLTRHDATVTVGAVLNGKPIRDSEVCILTTEAGAKALGFEMTEITGMEISLTQDIDLETEQALEKRLERIAMRGDMTLFNWLQSWRDEVASIRSSMGLLAALLLLFFTLAVAMQVGNAGRRIRADARMIGTLRAVGADEKALLGCYRLPLLLTTGIGAALGAGAYIAIAIWYHVQTGEHMHTIPVLAAMLILAALCALCCLAGLRMRLKSVLDQSIVENIREL